MTVVVLVVATVVVVGPHAAQQLVLPLTMPPPAVHRSADRLMLHFAPVMQSREL
jgi:hypothetical protein